MGPWDGDNRDVLLPFQVSPTLPSVWRASTEDLDGFPCVQTINSPASPEGAPETINLEAIVFKHHHSGQIFGCAEHQQLWLC